MIKSFEDWMLEESPFKGNENNKDCKWASKFMQRPYEAGQQSKQDEIDCLEVKLEGCSERSLAILNHKNKMVDNLQSEIDGLNLKIKRLIESEENIARSCQGWRDAHRELDERIIKALDMLEGREGKVLFDDILDVLKGVQE